MRVFLLGLGEQLQNSLNFLFDSTYRGEYVFVKQDADFSIVDIDNYDGKKLLRDHHSENPSQVIILLSVKEMEVQSDANIVYLRKPFSKEQMVTAIEQASNKAKVLAETSSIPPSEGLIQQDSEQVIQHADQNQETAARTEPIADVAPHAAHPAHVEHRPYVGNIQKATLAISKEDMLQILENNDGAMAVSADEELEYSPQRYLSGALLRAYRRAAKNGCQLRLKVRDCAILLDPIKKQAWLDMDKIKAQSLASIPLEKGWIEQMLLDKGQTSEPLPGSAISIEALIWETALYGARGRLPKGTLLDCPVKLKHWPNFTRVLLFPEAMRISAMFSEHTYSLTKTAELLRIDVRCVYSFYSAAYALGLVSICQPDKTITEKPIREKPLAAPRKRNLFNGILKRLKTSIFSEES